MIWGVGLLKGMRVTMKNALRGPITLRYPEEKAVLPQRARWAVGVKLRDDGSPKCTACEACVRECPDRALHMEIEVAGDRTKTIRDFSWESGACMFCALCVRACPFGALHMTKEYELATTETSGLRRVLLADVRAASPKGGDDA